MLKIKDSIDLKELENLGFHDDDEYGRLEFKIGNTQALIINKWNKKIRISQFVINPLGEHRNLDEKVINKLFDLIQAGFIEKVGDENG